MRKLVLYIVLAVVLAAVAELLLSASLLYLYRLSGKVRDGGSLSSVAVALKTIRRAPQPPIPTDGGVYEFSQESTPNPFLRNDDEFGYTANPGVYTHVYRRRPKGSAAPWERFPVKVTMNDDGSRWTGRAPRAGVPDVYLLGDSYVFGSGVNDEQTFAYLLQAALPQVDVRLFALGGYSTVQAWRRIAKLKDGITADDAIVIGYADFYDVRNVAAPSRMKKVDEARKSQRTLRPLGASLKADLDDGGAIRMSLVSEDCGNNGGYCEGPDPAPRYMGRVSAALINGIAAMTPAKVYLLYLSGPADNPVLKQIDARIEIISVLPADFDYFINDDVEGFDPHPGPYWHYAVASRLIDRLRERFPAAPQVPAD
jgi:hypothetical protein